MRTAIIILAATASVAALAQDLPPVVGTNDSLKDLSGTDTLVTVVLKPTGALDQNLRVLTVGPDYVSVVAESGESTAYLLSSIREVRVQKGRVEKRKLKLSEVTLLRVEEQRVLDRALARAREIFDAASANQNLKMLAATLMAADNDSEALNYLQRLAATDHVETQLDAYQCLYLAGANDPATVAIKDGLQSGNRRIKAKAATLAGLYGDQSVITDLAPLLQDRLAEISAPAAKALARLGWREAVPTLFRMITELNEEKGNAALYGLARLDGPEVLAQVKEMLKTAKGLTRQRLILLLYKLDDPDGVRLLKTEGLHDPGQALEAAAALAKRGEWDGRQYLFDYLKEKYYDETELNLVNRAKAAVALVAAGDLTATSELQNLLNINNAVARKKISFLAAEVGKRKLIPVMQPIMENADMGVAVVACTAVVAMARPQFQERLVELMN